jgi:glycosyltransferase involved in cell wall biosynthesis
VAENVANTIFEGMACGLPVLAYDVGGIKDAVKPGQTGELVLPVAGEPLGRALATLLAAPASMAEMGARGRRLVLERFTNRRQGESFLALYQDLHASFVPGPPSGT